MGNSVSFNQRVFYSKDDFADFLRSKLENGELSEDDKDELVELYCQGAFELFGFQNNNEEFKSERLARISTFFNLENNIKLNIEDYLNIKEVTIPLLDGEIIKDNTSLSFSAISLKLESIPTGAENPINYVISFKYLVKKTANEIVTPILFFYEGEKITREYKTESVSLSCNRDGTIQFEIPLMDLIQNNSGTYILSCNESALCRVAVPKVKLPLGRDGVASLEQFKDFLSTLNGEPTKDLLFLYFFLRYHFLEYWINDEDIKNKIHNLLADWERKDHTITINDINSIFPLLGVENKLCFHIMDYIRIDMVDISFDDPNSVIRTVAYHNHYIKWKCNGKGRISISISPKENVTNWNIEFEIGFRVGNKSLSGKPIAFNLNELEGKVKHFLFHFKCDDFSEQHIGTYALSLTSEQENIKTNCSFSITGQVIEFNLSNNVQLKMVGIMADSGEDFFIAQTPITQKQLHAIVCGAKESKYGDLKYSLAESVNAHKGDNYPATHLTYGDCRMINSYLSYLLDAFFCVPNCKHLLLVLSNGISNNTIDLDAIMPLKYISEVGQNHVTDLGIFDMLNNIYLHTDDYVTHVFSEDERIVFGASYNEEIHEVSELKHAYRESFLNYKSVVGFSPIAYINIWKNDIKERFTGTINDNNDDIPYSNSSLLGDISSMEYFDPADYAEYP